MKQPPAKKCKNKAVRLNVYMPLEELEALHRLQEMTNSPSVAETIRFAVRLSIIIKEEIVSRWCEQ